MIPIAAPIFLGHEKEYVMDCLTRMELSGGSYVQRFEDAFAEFCGVEHAITCCNGTAALHLALLALGVKAGDRVLMPALTYVATANAVRYCGAIPVFCDVDPLTWCLDPVDVREKLVRFGAVGLLPVHLYGMPCDMNALTDIANEFDLWVVEDAAEAHGATYGEHTVGSLGELGVFSFYGNKILTCGEGGMVTTDDDTLARRARLFRGQGADLHRRYWHSVVGYNYRLTNMQAALGLAQLDSYVEHVAARSKVVERYHAKLSMHFGVQHVTLGAKSANWMFGVLMPRGIDRDGVMHTLAHAGVDTRPFFYPVTALPPYYRSKAEALPISTDLSSRGLCLPTHAGLTVVDIDTVCEALLAAVYP